MSILGNMGWSNGIEWSVVYDLSNRTVNVAIEYNFDEQYKFNLQ